MNDLDVLDDPALAGLFDELRALGGGSPPSIGGELAAFLAGGAPLERRRHPAVVIAFLSATVLGGTIGSAAADMLPDPAQRFVAGVIRTFTPFDLTSPADEVGLEQPPPVPARLTPAREPGQSHSTAPSVRPEDTSDEQTDEGLADEQQADEEQSSEELADENQSGEDGSDARQDDSGSATERGSDEVGPAPVDIEDSPAPSAPTSGEPSTGEPSTGEGSSDGSGNLTELDASDSGFE